MHSTILWSSRSASSRGIRVISPTIPGIRVLYEVPSIASELRAYQQLLILTSCLNRGFGIKSCQASMDPQSKSYFSFER